MPKLDIKLIQACNRNMAVAVSVETLINLENRFNDSSVPLVSIHNPNATGENDQFLAGFISTPEIEAFRVKNNLDNSYQIDLMHQISSTSGLPIEEVYSYRQRAIKQGEPEISQYLVGLLDKYKEKKRITTLPFEVKSLDLSRKDHIIRAIQIEQAIARKKSALKSMNKYLSNCDPDTKQKELQRIEKEYIRDLNDPIMVGNEQVASAILEKEGEYLCHVFINGLFECCERVFKAVTGVAIHRLSKTNKRQAILKWAATS